ncbi:MAG: hypothetical protein PUA72_10660 [Lachnospiraceae bacterium]|nr:hypothetical protein [Lachnospiraceae bacterium]
MKKAIAFMLAATMLYTSCTPAIPVSAASSEVNYAELYKDVIKDIEKNGVSGIPTPQNLYYNLDYVNNDDIPELIVSAGCYDDDTDYSYGKNVIYTVKGNKAVQCFDFLADNGEQDVNGTWDFELFSNSIEYSHYNDQGMYITELFSISPDNDELEAPYASYYNDDDNRLYFNDHLATAYERESIYPLDGGASDFTVQYNAYGGSDADEMLAYLDVISDHISQIYETYEQNYNEEYDGFNEYMAEYNKSREDAEAADDGTRELFSSDEIMDMAESLVQGEAEFSEEHPEYRDALTSDLAAAHSDSLLGYYLFKGSADYLLSDDSAAQELRTYAVAGALGLLNGVFSLCYDNAPSIQAHMYEPVAVNDNYALLRTYGTLDSVILDSFLKSIREILDPADARLQELQERLSECENGYQFYRDGYDDDSLAVIARMHAIQNVRNEEIDLYLGFYQDICEMYQAPYATDGYIYQIIDSKGNIYGSFYADPSANVVFGNDGTCIIDKKFERDDYVNMSNSHTIIDKDMNVLFQSNQSEDDGYSYLGAGPSGKALRISSKTDFDNGQYYSLELVNLDNNSQELAKMTEFTIDTLYTDLYPVYYWDPEGHSHDVVIDLKNEKVLDSDDVDLSTDTELPEGLPSNCQVLNPDYFFNPEDNCIYDQTGKSVTDLSAGLGVSYIGYALEKYWVVSNSGYYYILDEYFNRLFEPVQIVPNDYMVLSPIGLIIGNVLWDSNGNSQEYEYVRQRPTLDHFIYGNAETGYINMNTNEILELIALDQIPAVLCLYSGDPSDW